MSARVDLAEAVAGLEGWLEAGDAYERRGGRPCPLDAAVKVALDALRWRDNPDEARDEGVEPVDAATLASAVADLRKVRGSGPFEKDIRAVVRALASSEQVRS